MMKFNYKYGDKKYSVSARDLDRAYCRLKSAVIADGGKWSGRDAVLISIGNAI